MNAGQAQEIAFEAGLLEKDLTRIARDRPIAHFRTKVIDDLVGGVKARLTIFSGGPGKGKSTLVHQLGDELAAQGVKTMYFTFEMSRQDLLEKSFSRLSKGTIPVSQVPEAASMGSDDFKKVVAAYRSSIADNMAISAEHFTPKQISAAVKRLKRESGGNDKFAVIIDYLQIMEPDSGRGRGDDRAALKEIISSLRTIVEKEAVPIIAISAINRSSYKKASVDIDALAESASLEYAADTVLFLSAGETKNNHPKDSVKRFRPMELTVLKNRYGALGSASLVFNAEFATFWEA